MTEIIIDGFATDDEPIESTGRFKDIFGDPFGEPHPHNPFTPEGFGQTFDRVSQQTDEANAAKPRPKGIGEDWFRRELRRGLERNRDKNGLSGPPSVALAADAPSKRQHAKQKADAALHKGVKTAQDHKLRKQQALGRMQKQLAALNTKRPKDPAKIKTWTERRRSLAEKISAKRESIRYSDQRVAGLRTEYREN